MQLPLGTYDFYFIANETTYPGDFVTALNSINNVSEFTTDIRFTGMDYNPDFLPDGSSPAGRFLMSAVYNNITVTSGGTQNNPLPLPLPTTKVELIRSLAKIEVVFRKRVSGSTIPTSAIGTVQLTHVASNLSVPPYDIYYTGATGTSNTASLAGLDFDQDSIGSVLFYIPEFLIPDGNSDYTTLMINNDAYPIQTDAAMMGITEQRRTIPALSVNSVIRNYHYIVNAYVNMDGNVELQVHVTPWKIDKYRYFFNGDITLVVPPIDPTDSSIIIPTDCGKIEILSHNEYLQTGLQGAYNDVVNWYDPVIQGPVINRGDPPYYYEKKYGPGWRLMNSCELMSFLAILDEIYKVWMSNTWDAYTYNQQHRDDPLPYYPVYFRRIAQSFLEEFTGKDLSGTVLNETNDWGDKISDTKLDIIDKYFTPGDIMVKEEDYPNGWPFPASLGTNSGEKWYYNESVIQVRAFWYTSGYIDISDRNNWEKILYGHEFKRYDYGSTVCRCVREVK